MATCSTGNGSDVTDDADAYLKNAMVRLRALMAGRAHHLSGNQHQIPEPEMQDVCAS